MERNNPINSVYLIALACASLILYVNSLYTALIYGLVTVAVFLVSVSIVSMIEKVADKHVRYLIVAIISAALITILKVVCGYINIQEVVLAGENLEITIVPCLLLSIVPIYFEDAFSARQFFANSLLISFGTILILLIFGILTEMLGYGAIAGVSIGFDGLEFFAMPYGALMILATLTIIFNIVRRTYLKKTRRFEMLVEKYKIQIREIKEKKHALPNNQNAKEGKNE